MNIEITLRCPYDKKGGVTSIDKKLALELIEQAMEIVDDGLYVTIWRSWDGSRDTRFYCWKDGSCQKGRGLILSNSQHRIKQN